MAKDWGGLLPGQVAEWINFDAEDPSWFYDGACLRSMANCQAEGVAYLWNLLSKQRVALLADEVGMGKTFQALGVAALLWKMKPDARVLVMAPNRDICAHWRREFAAFTRLHYRHADGRVKSPGDGLPVPPVEAQYRLPDLADAIEGSLAQHRPAQLYLTTIHALSGLVDAVSTSASNELAAAAAKAAERLHERIVKALDPQGFDLVIIDEAHYFRNRYGGSQRAAAAERFFGGPGKPLGQRTLLITATPSHGALGDVANILGYFVDLDEAEREGPAETLMRKYGLRRFRIMAGKDTGYIKHQYRLEKATPCDFTGRPEAEMFFALYQHRLVHEMSQRHEKRQIVYGFLEGFESAGAESLPRGPASGEGATASEEPGRDFHAAPDSELLRMMSADFQVIHGTLPDHPKYGRLVEQCVPPALLPSLVERPLHEEKHLIFVRRIPSVRELTRRINARYDELLAREIYEAWDLHEEDRGVRAWRLDRWSRKAFNKLLQGRTSSAMDFDEAEADEPLADPREEGGQDPSDAYLGSRIADLFVTKKPVPGHPLQAPTDCSRFSLNFRKSTSIHAMFMEPAADYLAAGYRWYYEYRQTDKLRADYSKAAQAQRQSAHGCFPRFAIEALRPPGASERLYELGPLETLWSLVFPLLDDVQRQTLRRWADERPEVAENFSNYVKAGFLFASPVVVELYGWYTRFQRSQTGDGSSANAQRRYRDFVEWVRPRIQGSLLLKYFAAALDTFEQLCDKIIDHGSADWKGGWRTLTTLSNPAAFASGESSHRQHLILGFNSPFYPNVLVSTSVFQEGVNLHLQCRKVHHYGIAWTPGDNEQRVGRVDRLFGKVNRLLKERSQSEATLDINYPYLKNSFDEDQVGSFIERKHAVEEKMDRCIQDSFDKTVQLIRPGWQDFLRRPTAKPRPDDPYPAVFDPDKLPKRPYPGGK